MKTQITKTFNQSGYKQTIKFLMESKTIFFIDCDCPDFVHRRLKQVGQFSDIKIFAECCKHLKPIVEYYEKIENFKLKKPKNTQGTDKCSNKLRNTLINRSGGKCEICGQIGSIVHRRIRGKNGGKYNEQNCGFVCPSCHRKIHSGEFV